MKNSGLLRDERGFILGMTIILAFIFSMAAYANLILAISQGEQARFWRDRPPSRYAAEAGLVLVRERLWANPAYCGQGGTGTWTEQVDTNGSGSIDAADRQVQLTITNCGAINRHTITAKVLY